MIWLYIILAGAAVATALFEFYVRFLPAWKEKKIKKRQARFEIQSQLEIFIVYVELYDWGGISSLEKAYKDAPISKQLVRELDELIKLAIEYYRWRYECFQVVKSEVIAQSKGLENLDEIFIRVFRSGFESVMDGTEGSVSENIYKAIYKRELTFNIAKESLLKGHWDRKVIVQDEHGEQKELMFKDIIDGGEFHKFIENLIKLQNRESVKTLRDVQARLLEKARLTLKEVS